VSGKYRQQNRGEKENRNNGRPADKRFRLHTRLLSIEASSMSPERQLTRQERLMRNQALPIDCDQICAQRPRIVLPIELWSGRHQQASVKNRAYLLPWPKTDYSRVIRHHTPNEVRRHPLSAGKSEFERA
jgi:hypothetical protein